MDPAIIIGLSAAIQQLLGCIYTFAQGVRESKREINLLCSELHGLEAAIKHVQLNLQLTDQENSDIARDAQRILSSSNFVTQEFREMVSFTNEVVATLLRKLDIKPGRYKSTLQRLTWPLVKDDVKLYVERLERSKQYFILATTSDNL